MEEDIENPENTGLKRDSKGHFLPGVSGHPEGKPKGSLSITAMVKAMLDEAPEGNKATYAEALIKSILKKAIVEGDSTMQKTVWSYIDGMPPQELKMSGGLSNLQGVDIGEDNKKLLNEFILWRKKQI